EGDTHHGWWRIIAADPPHSLEIEDGFADADGAVNPDLPTITMQVRLTTLSPDRTAMVVTSRFASLAAMQELESMGMEEGARQAAEQIDDILAGIATT
ncbi:MAG: SRPBCC domain-containing protein, partial [Acidimicrobiales bacterium]|nr:SRPBCC domain-containing protein [Acidimicrobiales bacterium]